MKTSTHHYSPFSPNARKWMITIGTLAFVAGLAYALSTGVISYLDY